MVGWLRLGASGAIALCLASCGGTTRAGEGGSGGAAATGGAPGSGGATSTGGAPATGGRSRYLYAHEFDQSCKEPEDCAPVHEGEQCTCAACPTAAIARPAVPSWDAAVAALACVENACDPVPTVCSLKVMGCVDNRCAVMDPPVVNVDDYDRKCRIDADCRVILTGELCDGCACSAGGVSAAGHAEWSAQVGHLACLVHGPVCRCAVPSTPVCDIPPGASSGTCEAEF